MLVIPVLKGTPDYPRYLISDDQGRYWSGVFWASSEKEAKMYLDLGTVGRTIREIYLLEWKGTPCNQFVVPCIIEMFGEQIGDMEQLRDWLTKAATIFIDHKQFGTGPIEDSLILPQIRWSDLKGIKT
jgi:hypothetical protein